MATADGTAAVVEVVPSETVVEVGASGVVVDGSARGEVPDFRAAILVDKSGGTAVTVTDGAAASSDPCV